MGIVIQMNLGASRRTPTVQQQLRRGLIHAYFPAKLTQHHIYFRGKMALVGPSYLMIGSPLDLLGKMKVDCPKPAKLLAIEEGNS